MENKNLIMTVMVTILEPVSVKGTERDIVMIPFTGVASGELFNGSTIGQCVDTQKIPKGGEAMLSARYMLEGTDADGKTCRIFIENEGSWNTGFHPVIVTDSPRLSAWEKAELSAEVLPAEGGVEIRIYE